MVGGVSRLGGECCHGCGSSSSGCYRVDGVQVDAQHSGYVYGAGVVPPLTKAWSDDLNWRNEYVAIDGGHVFAVESSGGGKDALASIDLGSGEVTWSAALGDVFGSNVNLVVDSGRVFTATAISSPGAGGYVLAAWNEQTGAMIWSDRVSTFYDVEAAPPIVDNGVLHFVFGGTRSPCGRLTVRCCGPRTSGILTRQ